MAYFGHGQQRSLAHTTVFCSAAAVPDGHGVSERGFEALLGGQRSANLIKGWNSCSFCLEFRVSNFPLTSKALLPVKNSKSQSTHSQPQECQLKRTSIIEKVAKLELPVDEQAIKVEITKLHSILGGVNSEAWAESLLSARSANNKVARRLQFCCLSCIATPCLIFVSDSAA